MSFSLVFDGLLASLLLVTLIYIARLNKRLGNLRSSRQEFETLIARFTHATEQADRSLASIKAAAAEQGEELQATVDRSRGLREDLAFLVDKANGLADQLEASITRMREVTARPQAPSAQPVSAQPASAQATAAQEKPAQNKLSGEKFKTSGRPAALGANETLSEGEQDLLRALASIR